MNLGNYEELKEKSEDPMSKKLAQDSCSVQYMRIDVSVTREANESYELGKYKKTLCTVSIMLVQYKTKKTHA